jgi:hypothetical protein
MTDEDLRRRLADLIVEALEVGSGKQEWDVVDEVFDAFGVAYRDLEATLPHLLPGRTRKLRELASSRLAAAAPTASDLVNVVVRCGGRFIAMLEATYERLTRHAATTAGSSETFRLEREGIDEAPLTISPAFLEQVRQLKELLRSTSVGKIDEEALRSFLLWDNGELYGRWPLSRDKDSDRLADALMHLLWIGPVLREHAPTHPDWAEALNHWETAHTAGERLIVAAEELVRSHVAHMDALADVDATVAADELFMNGAPKGREHVLSDEIERFRADRILADTAVPGCVHDVDTSSAVGMSGDLEPVVTAIDDYQVASGVGSLAGFVALWRLALWPERERTQMESRLLDDPVGLVSWLDWVTTACGEATIWVENEVLDVTASVEVTEQIEAVEEFLNLPLWRQRHLLYEVWVLCATLDACETAEWKVDLSGLTSTDGVWVLSVGPSDQPAATLSYAMDESVRLDVWREPARQTADGVLTPDVTVATPAPYVRDLLVVEAKDRQKMTVGQIGNGNLTPGQRTALGVAHRYAAGLHPIATWVCNHCDFRQGVGPEVNHGDLWTQIHVADSFRPGEVPAAFTSSVRTALRPPSEKDHNPAAGLPAAGLILVVDVTGSMGGRLDTALRDLTLVDGGAPFQTYRAVLFSDHGARESLGGDDAPFLVRKVGPFPSVERLIENVCEQPRGGGGDIPEALEDAMQRCREIIDDVGAQTILILTDAPPHSPRECPYRVDFDAEVRALLQSGCQVHVAHDWLDPADATWTRFSGMDGVRVAPLAEILASWLRGQEVSSRR